MNSKTIANGILRAVAIIAGVALLLLFLYKIQSAIVYLSVAIVLSLIARPFNNFLREKLKFPNTLAISITMLIFISVIFGIISLFIPLIVKQGHNLSLLNTDAFQASIIELLNQLNEYFSIKGIDLFSEVKDIDLSTNIKSIPSVLNTMLGAIGSISMGLFSILFIVFFLMKDRSMLYDLFLAITPDEKEERLLKSLNTISGLLSRYFIGLIVQISILFIIYSIILLVFNIESAIVIAFLCALLNIIPYIGPLFGGVLMLTLTMTSNLDHDFQSYILPTTLYVFIGYVVAQLIDNIFSQPLIFSKSVKSHPLEIFLIIIIGGLLFGIVGMILAVPSYTALKVILKEYHAKNDVVKHFTKKMD